MKTAIDSYCYHRFFGEVYPQQTAPPCKLTLEDFLRRAHALHVGGVSLESCFIPQLDSGYLTGIRGLLEEYDLDCVFAWGHPDGLEGGSNEQAYTEMIRDFEAAQKIGAKVMRVVGSSLRFRNQPHAPQIERLTKMLREAVKVAENYGIRMAIENHIDFTADEMLALLTNVDSSWLGINFDTGNFLRLLDDPIKGMAKLAPYVYATHIKDLKVQKGVPADEWYFFSCVAVGEGLVDNAKLVQLLASAGYEGLLAVEIDFLHPDCNEDEDGAVVRSVNELKRLAEAASAYRDAPDRRPVSF